MRSLWRMIAARWLGGQASDALTGDAALLDLLMPRDSEAARGFWCAVNPRCRTMR